MYKILIFLFLVLHCRGQSNGDLRLNNDELDLFPNITEGRLEIYLESEWGTVCRDGFDDTEATVACRQLGFSEAESHGVAKSLGFKFGGDEVLIHLDEINCTGKEDSLHLLSCSTNAHGRHDCVHTEDIALKCSSILLSEADPFDGQVRLTRGRYSSEGLVEVYCNEEWGTVCDDMFSTDEADTTCQQLGYTHAEKFDHLQTIFGAENQSIWLDDVQCTTSRQCISQCQRCPEKENHNCMHSEDVTIQCSFDSGIANGMETSVGLISCKFDYGSSSISGEIVAVIIVSIIFATACVSLCSLCIALAVAWRRSKRKAAIIANDDSISNTTEMTRSMVSSQPIPPPRPSDLPPLSTPTSAFSPTFSPFSPFDMSNQPLPPPRPQNLGTLPTPTKQLNPLFSPFPMPPAQSTYESTPVYIAPGNTGRPIYIEPTKMNAELPPPYPNCVNHYERTPTGVVSLGTTSTRANSPNHYESIPPLVDDTHIGSNGHQHAGLKQVTEESDEKSRNGLGDEEEYEKLNQFQSIVDESCQYDNLEPSAPDKVPDGNHTTAPAYVNLETVQVEEVNSSYDVLKPVVKESKPLEEHPYDLPEVNVTAKPEIKPCDTDEEDESPRYENTPKNFRKHSCTDETNKGRKNKCSSVSW